MFRGVVGYVAKMAMIGSRSGGIAERLEQVVTLKADGLLTAATDRVQESFGTVKRELTGHAEQVQEAVGFLANNLVELHERMTRLEQKQDTIIVTLLDHPTKKEVQTLFTKAVFEIMPLDKEAIAAMKADGGNVVPIHG